MEDEFDIYEDLQQFEEGEKQKISQAEIKDLTDKIDKLNELLSKSEEEKINLTEEKKQLEKNVSSLLLTAKSEVERKEKEIVRLREEKDNIQFRRRPRNNTRDIQTDISLDPLAFVNFEVREKSNVRNEKIHNLPKKNPFATSRHPPQTTDLQRHESNDHRKRKSRSPEYRRRKDHLQDQKHTKSSSSENQSAKSRSPQHRRKKSHSPIHWREKSRSPDHRGKRSRSSNKKDDCSEIQKKRNYSYENRKHIRRSHSSEKHRNEKAEYRYKDRNENKHDRNEERRYNSDSRKNDDGKYKRRDESRQDKDESRKRHREEDTDDRNNKKHCPSINTNEKTAENRENKTGPITCNPKKINHSTETEKPISIDEHHTKSTVLHNEQYHAPPKQDLQANHLPQELAHHIEQESLNLKEKPNHLAQELPHLDQENPHSEQVHSALSPLNHNEDGSNGSSLLEENSYKSSSNQEDSEFIDINGKPLKIFPDKNEDISLKSTIDPGEKTPKHILHEEGAVSKMSATKYAFGSVKDCEIAHSIKSVCNNIVSKDDLQCANTVNPPQSEILVSIQLKNISETKENLQTEIHDTVEQKRNSSKFPERRKSEFDVQNIKQVQTNIKETIVKEKENSIESPLIPEKSIICEYLSLIEIKKNSDEQSTVEKETEKNIGKNTAEAVHIEKPTEKKLEKTVRKSSDVEKQNKKNVEKSTEQHIEECVPKYVENIYKNQSEPSLEMIVENQPKTEIGNTANNTEMIIKQNKGRTIQKSTDKKTKKSAKQNSDKDNTQKVCNASLDWDNSVNDKIICTKSIPKCPTKSLDELLISINENTRPEHFQKYKIPKSTKLTKQKSFEKVAVKKMNQIITNYPEIEIVTTESDDSTAKAFKESFPIMSLCETVIGESSQSSKINEIKDVKTVKKKTYKRIIRTSVSPKNAPKSQISKTKKPQDNKIIKPQNSRKNPEKINSNNAKENESTNVKKATEKVQEVKQKSKKLNLKTDEKVAPSSLDSTSTVEMNMDVDIELTQKLSHDTNKESNTILSLFNVFSTPKKQPDHLLELKTASDTGSLITGCAATNTNEKAPLSDVRENLQLEHVKTNKTAAAKKYYIKDDFVSQENDSTHRNLDSGIESINSDIEKPLDVIQEHDLNRKEVEKSVTCPEQNVQLTDKEVSLPTQTISIENKCNILNEIVNNDDSTRCDKTDDQSSQKYDTLHKNNRDTDHSSGNQTPENLVEKIVDKNVEDNTTTDNQDKCLSSSVQITSNESGSVNAAANDTSMEKKSGNTRRSTEYVVEEVSNNEINIYLNRKKKKKKKIQ